MDLARGLMLPPLHLVDAAYWERWTCLHNEGGGGVEMFCYTPSRQSQIGVIAVRER